MTQDIDQPQKNLQDSAKANNAFFVQRPTAHWVLFAALVLLYASAFGLYKITLETIPPMTTVASRMIFAGLLFWALMKWQGHVLPALFVGPQGQRHINPLWKFFFALGFVGNSLPFFLIGWGQQVIDSGPASILIAFMPLITLVLAHFMVAGETLNLQKILGFIAGLTGIVTLAGYDAFSTLGRADNTLIYQLALLGGATCYAVNSIVTKHLPPVDVIVSGTGISIAAFVMTAPMALLFDFGSEWHPSTRSIIGLIAMGIFPTALGTLAYLELIRRAGPTFFSMTNYLVPICAVAIGYLFLNESVSPQTIISLALILTGIGITQIHWRPQTKISPSK